jgi:hypothetical protein
MTPIIQPQKCGNFTAYGYRVQSWETSINGGGEKNFNVPSGMKFFLKNIQIAGNSNSDRINVSYGSIILDTVRPFSSFPGSLTNNATSAANLISTDNDPMYQVKDQIILQYSCNNTNGGSGSGKIYIDGYFVEDK